MKDFSFKSKKPVCFFDSGIGGLNLLGECIKRIPNKQFVYFADNFNVPYGNYSEEKILILANKIFSEIQQYNPIAAVIACNTVTAVCIEYLRNKYSFPIIGIQPAIKPAAKNCRRCVVLATPATAHSTGICRLVERFGRGVTDVVACDKLAAYIENNVFDNCEDYAISIWPENTGNKSVHKNIRILNNKFISDNGKILIAKCADGVIFDNNEIITEQKVDVKLNNLENSKINL